MNDGAHTQPKPFDAKHWKRVNEALDQALELEGGDAQAFLDALAHEDSSLALEVARLHARAMGLAQPGATTALNPSPPARGLTTELATVFKDLGSESPLAERGFDDLLQRALRAERATQRARHFDGEICGAWRLRHVIGTGGMGEVWLADRADGLYEAKAAVKFLRPDGDIERFEARFSQERALLARLNHPGIARLLDAGRQFGAPFLVLEYVQGENLLDYVREHAPSVEERLALIRQIGEAIAYAHSQLVVHRDLKPSNVLVTAEGRVKLLDFGVAGLLADNDFQQTTESPATRIAGRGLTPEYAAPEQITGEASGVASDVYSLGALTFHLLTGRRAHLPDTPGRAAMEHAILHTDAPRVSDAARRPLPAQANDTLKPPVDLVRLNADIDAIVASMMRRDPHARYRTAGEALADLYRFSAHRPIAARAQDRAYRTRLWLRRNRLPFALAVSLVAALMAGLAVSLWQAERARDEADRANKTADYLVELLAGADPDLHGGNWPSALDLIERAERDLKTRFQNEPSVEQKISQSVATTLRRLSRFQEAKPIAERSYLLSRSLYGDKAESTRIAAALLADIFYWLDNNPEATTLVERALGERPPAPLPEWWREAFLLRANLDSERREFAKAHAGYDAYRELIRGHPHETWLAAESETDRATSMETEGRQKEALALHNRYRSALANPPKHVARRIALTNLNNGDLTRLFMGQFENMEAAFRDNLTNWDQLAGRINRHSIEAVGRLGLFYYHSERPQEALAMFREKQSRLESARTRSESDELFVRIDILETLSKYQLEKSDVILQRAVQVERDILAADSLDKTTTERLLQRVALVRLTFGDSTALVRSVAALPPPKEAAGQRPSRAATRWLALASLHASNGNYADACSAASFAADNFGSKLQTLVAAPIELRRTLFCMLSGSPQTTAHLAAARRALPAELPRDHRLWRVFEHLERSARSQTKDEVLASQGILARELNIPGIATLHPALLGLVF